MRRSTSVIIPAHNAESTIAQAIVSALGQSTPPSEVIVVCDGCTDDTASAAKTSGAKVIEIERANGSVARNVGAGRSFGELLFFLDADDWWESDKIKAHEKIWDEQNATFVIDRSRPFLPNGDHAHWLGGLAEERLAEWHEFLSYRAWASGSSFSVRREVYARIDGFNEHLNKFQDVDFWIRAAHEFGPAYCIGRALTNYRLTSGPSISKTTADIEANLAALFEKWPFANALQMEGFRRHAYLTAAEVTPWPKSLEYFSKAHWPLTKRFFWKSLLGSISSRGAA